MKISLDWIKEYTNINVPIEQLIEKIGSQLGAVEEVQNYGDKYKNALIVKVVSCQDHPNADRLHICKIDDGGLTKDVARDDNKLIQVICGAPNIATGQNVVWLPPGAIVPETFDYPIPAVLEVKLIRDIVSYGMIASQKELALGDDMSGILVIDAQVKPGTALIDYYNLKDYIIDIENKMFTHRPDCFGILGVAREIAGIQHLAFKSPDWYLKSYLQTSTETAVLPLAIRNELPELVPRFMAIAMSGIKVGPSPIKLQSYLTRVGIRSINNIVDITNYLMILTGQPLHAYDYDKVLAKDTKATVATLVARYPKKDEQLILLNDKTIIPKEGTIIIATDSTAIGLGGIMGGADTEVDNNTKNIILECANFDMYAIRRSSMAHGLFTDAVTRFNKGQSPLQNDSVLAQAVALTSELAGGVTASPILDDRHFKKSETVSVTAKFINERLGLNLDSGQIAQLLKNVEFTVNNEGDNLIINAPFWRTDIVIPEDVVEEIGRLYGYDKLPQQLPKRTLLPAANSPLLQLKTKLRSILSANGANEILTYSFVHGNLLKKIGQDESLAFQLNNAISPDLQYFRMSLIPSLLEKIHFNIKNGYEQFVLYEIGKTHIKDWLDDERLPKEEQRLGLVFAADKKAALNYGGAAYYQARHYLEALLKSLNIEPLLSKLPEQSQLPVYEQMMAGFSRERSAIVMEAKSGELLGVIGEFKPSITKALKLPVYCAGFELDIIKLLKFHHTTGHYLPLSRYPKVEQDISVKVDSDLTYAQLHSALKDVLDKQKPLDSQVNLNLLDIYQKPEELSNKQVTFRLQLVPYQKTLTAEEVNHLLDNAATELRAKFNIVRI